MESREITRDEIVQAFANKIKEARGYMESIPWAREETLRYLAGEANGVLELAAILGLAQEVEDVLYLMEEGPER